MVNTAEFPPLHFKFWSRSPPINFPSLIYGIDWSRLRYCCISADAPLEGSVVPLAVIPFLPWTCSFPLMRPYLHILLTFDGMGKKDKHDTTFSLRLEVWNWPGLTKVVCVTNVKATVHSRKIFGVCVCAHTHTLASLNKTDTCTYSYLKWPF